MTKYRYSVRVNRRRLRLVEARPGIGVPDAAKELCLAGNSVSTLVTTAVWSGRPMPRTAEEP